MKAGFLIPVYNHGKTALPLTEKLLSYNLPVILVDDGSNGETKNFLKEAAKLSDAVFLVTLEKNQGKGAAFEAGLRRAAELSLDAILQIDADGQHDDEQARFFFEEARLNEGSIICGYPEFSDDAPRGRVIGRKISTFWAAVCTFSRDLKDVMCGFRVYPVQKTLSLYNRAHIDKRMGFDAEILIRLYWAGVEPRFFPVTVRYPPGGISNFHYIKDNARISLMFTKLCILGIFHLPRVLIRRICKRLLAKSQRKENA